MNLLIINGPNLNLLGQREPTIYGKETLKDILDDVYLYSKNHNFNVDAFQSNHEGEIVDMIQKSNDLYQGLIINPGALSHYSISIRDAISSISIPTVEVHLSNIFTREKFRNHLNGNKICGLNMFITKTHFYKEYCENLFPWLEKCLDYCINNNLCNGYNTRLPAFLAERFTSYWFSQDKIKSKYLSYARLGNFMLSNDVNKIINPTKIPFTFRMYPTIHNY